MIADALVAVFIRFGLHYALATLVAGPLSVGAEVFTNNSYFVFFNNDYRRVVRFFAVYTVIYAVNVGVQPTTPWSACRLAL